MKKSIMIIYLLLHAIGSNCQVTTGANSSMNMTDFVGWDANTSFDLNIKHEGNFPIVFWTDNQERMRLTPDGRLLINQSSSPFDASLDVIGKTVGVRGTAVSSVANINYGGWFSGAGN